MAGGVVARRPGAFRRGVERGLGQHGLAATRAWRQHGAWSSTAWASTGAGAATAGVCAGMGGRRRGRAGPRACPGQARGWPKVAARWSWYLPEPARPWVLAQQAGTARPNLLTPTATMVRPLRFFAWALRLMQ